MTARASVQVKERRGHKMSPLSRASFHSKERGVSAIRTGRATAESVHEEHSLRDVLLSENLRGFRRTVWNHWKSHGRHTLPWRQPSLKLRHGKQTFDPYKILVSEIMLQQTQVERVVPFYKNFLKKFPTARALAKASLSDVLIAWNGLGYNRRAKFLHEAAKAMALAPRPRKELSYDDLRALPGVGEYTAKAVRVFAYNAREVLIETNVRTAVIHHFFPHTPQVNDRTVLVYAQKAAHGQDPRTWHAALFDYGTHIKKTHPNPSRRSAHYARQPKFVGSLRQVRGAIVRAHTQGASLRDIRQRYPDKFDEAYHSLVRDGLITRDTIFV